MELNKFSQEHSMQDVPAASWLAVGLLDGIWEGGKVSVAVNISMTLNRVHLVHILAEKISRENSYQTIDMCFAYSPELDLFIPFTTSVAAAVAIAEQYEMNKNLIIQTALQLLGKSDNDSSS